MKGFYISVSNNLLSPEHCKKMGSAVWEFMWCLDKITKVDEQGVGWVLGGKPINLKDISDDLGLHEVTISRNLEHLEQEGYIKKTRTPYGIVIKIFKAKKSFNKKTESAKMLNLTNENVKSPNENVKSNKTIAIDNSSKTRPTQKILAGKLSSFKSEEPLNDVEVVPTDEDGNPLPSKTPKIDRRETKPFNLIDELSKLQSSSYKPNRVLYAYWTHKRYDFDNYYQWKQQYSRDIKAAKIYAEAEYTLSFMRSSMAYCDENYDKVGWTIETLLKKSAEFKTKGFS